MRLVDEHFTRRARPRLASGDLTVRWMTRRDLHRALAIEAECFEYPWSLELFEHHLSRRDCVALVVELTEGSRRRLAERWTPWPIGYVLYSFDSDSLRVLNLAVAPEWQLRGVGRALVAALKAKLTSRQRDRIECEVRETNVDAQLFCRRMGFRAVAVLHGRYDDCDEDS